MILLLPCGVPAPPAPPRRLGRCVLAGLILIAGILLGPQISHDVHSTGGIVATTLSTAHAAAEAGNGGEHQQRVGGSTAATSAPAPESGVGAEPLAEAVFLDLVGVMWSRAEVGDAPRLACSRQGPRVSLAREWAHHGPGLWDTVGVLRV